MTGRGRMEYTSYLVDLITVDFTCTFLRDTDEDTGWFDVDEMTVEVSEPGEAFEIYEDDQISPAMWEEVVNAIQTRKGAITWIK